MKAVALDTNLLLLLIIGRAAGRVVGRRLKVYRDEDLALLESCLAPFDRLIATPNAWTEFYNVWDWGIDGNLRADVLLASMEMVRESVELTCASSTVIADEEFGRLGLADCTWLAVLDRETTLLTDDLVLCNVALSRGFKAVNFTELRNFD